MPIVTPTLNLPQPTLSAASPARTAAAAAPAPAIALAPAPKAPDVPSATVTLSPQALSAMAAENHVSSPSPTTPTPTAVHDASLYESLKTGIASAATDVGDAIENGAHAVVDGVESTLSTAHKVAKGMLELPFAAVAKACDAAGAIIDAV
jgi:hypothetical protein